MPAMPRWSACALLWVAACSVPGVDDPKLEALADLSLCAGPEGLDDCSLERFEVTFADRLPGLRAHRDAVVERWRASLHGGNHAAAYALAWAGDEASLPALRQGLLEERYFYGWESSDAFTIAARMRDDQYPRHVARARAIEHLSGEDLATAVALTDDERAQLVRDAYAEGEAGGAHDAARWLLTRLAPEALVATPAPSDPLPLPLAVPSALEGWLLVSHDSFGHHDVLPIARAHAGTLAPVDPFDGCRVMPGREVALDGRLVTLPTELFDNEANHCLAEPEGLAPGHAVTALDLPLRAREAALEPALEARAEARALEALARLTGADPADFSARAEASAVTDGARTRVVVHAVAAARPREMDDRTIPCASALCRVTPSVPSWPASVVAVYAVDDHGALEPTLVVPSRPGGCGEEEHDEVSFIGAVLLDGATAAFVLERRFCDAWGVELHAEGRERSLVAARSGSAV